MLDISNLSNLINASDSREVRDAALIAKASPISQKDLQNVNADQVAADFESMFVSAMLEPMFGDSLGASLFGDEETAEVYKALMVQEYGKQITQAGGVGIASYVKNELLKLQEVK